jgi:hypothetical protein
MGLVTSLEFTRNGSSRLGRASRIQVTDPAMISAINDGIAAITKASKQLEAL